MRVKLLRQIIITTCNLWKRRSNKLDESRFWKKAVINPTSVKSRIKVSKRIPGQKDHALWLATWCWKVLMKRKRQANVQWKSENLWELPQITCYLTCTHKWRFLLQFIRNCEQIKTKIAHISKIAKCKTD